MNLFDIIPPDTLLAELGLDMEDKGDYFLGLCPFHSDSNPSFSIHKEGFYKCFSCSAKGNLYQLTKRITGKSAKELFNLEDMKSYSFINTLAKPKRNKFPDYSKIVQEGDTINPYDNKQCTEYLEKRFITKEFVEYFKLSYAHYTTYNFTRFIDRLIIPIYKNSNLVGIEGRDVTGKQKPKVLYCKGSKVNNIFNYDNLDLSKPVIVVEGIMDMVKIWENLSRNVCSIFGVSLSNYQIETLNTIPHLILFPDGDEAGEGLLEVLYDKLDREFDIVRIQGKDPNDANIREIKYALDNRVKSTNYFIDKSGLFDIQEKLYEWESEK